MTKLVLKETDNWTAEKARKIDLMLKDELSPEEKLFVEFVDLKQSFMDQALLMLTWCVDGYSEDLNQANWGTYDANQFFMSNGYLSAPPDRYKFRSDVFNSIAEAIKNDEECNPYAIVEQWDMLHHA